MASDFTVKPARPKDRAAVNALLKASYPALMAGSYDPDALAAALRPLTKAQPQLLRSGTYYLAETADGRAADRDIVGCGGWTRDRPGTGEVEGTLGHIRHFGTHPDWTGRGVGRAIYERCAAQAREAGITAFECHASLNAEGFYAKLGFAAVRRLDVTLNPRHSLPSVLMRREI